jgi:two-component system chemotaxis response regulator CheB
VVEKPSLASADDVRRFRQNFGSLLKLMAEVKVVRVVARDEAEQVGVLPAIPHDHAPVTVVGICASTGGPSALERVLSALSPCFPVPILVVQHMAEGFLEGFVEWMDANGPLRATVAADGEVPRGGSVYFAPDGAHMMLGVDRRIRIVASPPVRGHIPSGDILLESLAASFADRSLAVVLTGMGEDGARGAGAIASAGGVVIAQDEASSVVYGMPYAVIEHGVDCEVLPLDSIGQRVREWVLAAPNSTLDDAASPCAPSQ